MLNKIEITGTIELVTGMHIGASDGFAAIGAIDSPVAKDPVSRLPYIPGSSLKGKMRSLLAKAYNENLELVKTRDDDDERITRLFGTSKSRKDGNPSPSRLIFSDSILCNEKELKAAGAQSETEVKEENTINPLTAVATPRQLERVVRGAKFPLNIIYNVTEMDDFIDDMRTLSEGFRLLSYDYLGGHGSRGYGRISISDVYADCVIGEIDESMMEECRKILGDK